MAIAATHNTTQRGPPSSKTSRELLPLCALVVLAAFLIELLIPQRPSHVPYTSDLVLVTTDANQQFVYVDIALATQPFKVVLDTGSALTWILSENFTCFHNAVKLPQADCQVGSLYQIDRNFSSIPDEIVHMSYEPMSVMGFPGRTSVTLAGLTTTAKVGIVTKLTNNGISSLGSGVLGLGLSPGSGEWTATSTDLDHVGVPSKSLLTTIFEAHNVPRQFSLALSRGERNRSDGGTFVMGGLPDLTSPHINASDDFASIDMVPIVDPHNDTSITHSAPILAWYGITIEHFYYGTLGNMTMSTAPSTYQLDSGEFEITLPWVDGERFLASFNPPMFNKSDPLQVYCDAAVPTLRFRIGGKLFSINPKDIVWRRSDGLCQSTVKPSNETICFLGGIFHRNVVAVYDWENLQIHFASRPYYLS